VQANFDYTSERSCGERLAVANAIAPVVMALFADSPFVEGRTTPARSNRSAVWTDVDTVRCGTPAFALDGEHFGYERYIEWALDVPMFFVKRAGEYHPHHVPFREFLARGYQDEHGIRHAPVWSDWVTHLSTVFPEVRLKPFVEFRSADAVPSRYVCALPALLKGILYSDDARMTAHAALGRVTPQSNMELWTEARTHGMASPRIRAIAGALVDAARHALDGFDHRDDKGRTEARFLDPLDELVASGRSPADVAIAAVGKPSGGDAGAQRAYVRAFYFAGIET
jgi:glutamate--cysteine ligase